MFELYEGLECAWNVRRVSSKSRIYHRYSVILMKHSYSLEFKPVRYREYTVKFVGIKLGTREIVELFPEKGSCVNEDH